MKYRETPGGNSLETINGPDSGVASGIRYRSCKGIYACSRPWPWLHLKASCIGHVHTSAVFRLHITSSTTDQDDCCDGDCGETVCKV